MIVQYISRRNIFTQIKYGLLYNRNAVTDVRKLTSSDDWAVISRTQWDDLITYVGGSSVAAREVKEIGTAYWNDNLGLNTYGFNARGGGQRTSGTFNSLKAVGTWWTSTQTIPGFGRFISMTSVSDASTGSGAANDEGKSIRLIYVGAGSPTSYTGNDGKVYRTVTLNGVTYTSDNLAETKYRDGSWIAGYDGGAYTPIADATWAALTTGALCAYNNDTNNI